MISKINMDNLLKLNQNRCQQNHTHEIRHIVLNNMSKLNKDPMQHMGGLYSLKQNDPKLRNYLLLDYLYNYKHCLRYPMLQ